MFASIVGIGRPGSGLRCLCNHVCQATSTFFTVDAFIGGMRGAATVLLLPVSGVGLLWCLSVSLLLSLLLLLLLLLASLGEGKMVVANGMIIEDGNAVAPHSIEQL